MTLTVAAVPRPARDRGRGRARVAEARRVERLGLVPVPRQPARDDPRLRPVPRSRASIRRSPSISRRSSSTPSGSRPGSRCPRPAGFAPDLVREFGRFKTMGWAIDTWSIQSGTLPEEGVPRGRRRDGRAGPEDARRAARRRRTGCSSTTSSSRTAWRTSSGGSATRSTPPTTPRSRRSTATRSRSRTRRWTRSSATPRRRSRPTDVLIVLSDHGFATWRRVGQLQHLARRERLPRADGRGAAERASRRSSRAGSSGRTSTGRSRARTRWGSATSTST